eukprot:IDg6629t1
MKLQQRYKKNYDKHLRICRKHFEVGGYAFLRVEKNSEEKSTRRHKLAPIASGPLPVTTVKERTIVIERLDKTRKEGSIYELNQHHCPRTTTTLPCPSH